MKNLALGVSPINGTIYAGKLNKDKTMWVGEKQDVTEDAVRVVFEKMMQESQRKDGATIEYSYPSFGTMSFTPNKEEKE